MASRLSIPAFSVMQCSLFPLSLSLLNQLFKTVLSSLKITCNPEFPGNTEIIIKSFNLFGLYYVVLSRIANPQTVMICSTLSYDLDRNVWPVYITTSQTTFTDSILLVRYWPMHIALVNRLHDSQSTAFSHSSLCVFFFWANLIHLLIICFIESYRLFCFIFICVYRNPILLQYLLCFFFILLDQGWENKQMISIFVYLRKFRLYFLVRNRNIPLDIQAN